MGQHFNIAPVTAGIRQRDDYGAAAGRISPACSTISPLKSSLYRTSRSFPVVQPRKVGTMGRLNHDA